MMHVGAGIVGSTAQVHDHITFVATPAGTADGDGTNDVIIGAISGASTTRPSAPPSVAEPEPPPHAVTSATTQASLIFIVDLPGAGVNPPPSISGPSVGSQLIQLAERPGAVIHRELLRRAHGITDAIAGQ